MKYCNNFCSNVILFFEINCVPVNKEKWSVVSEEINCEMFNLTG